MPPDSADRPPDGRSTAPRGTATRGTNRTSRATRLRIALRRGIPYALVAAAGFLVAYLIVFFFIFPTKVVPEKRLKVPDVVGLLYDDAVRRLSTTGLNAQQGESHFHLSPAGTVLTQTPAAGSEVNAHERVVLDVSAGQRTAEVPGVIGGSLQAAQVAIENAGLALGAVNERADDAPRGTVLETSPAAGQTVTVPTAVAITVSSGPASIVVPDVTGRFYPEARRMLEQLGFRVGAPVIDSLSGQLPDAVLRQSPGGGTSAASGTQITLTIAGRRPGF